MEKKYALSFVVLFLLACYFNNSNSASFPVTISDSQQKNWTFTSATSVIDPKGNIYEINLGSITPNPSTDKVIHTIYTFTDFTTSPVTTITNYYYNLCRIDSQGTYALDGTTIDNPTSYTGDKYKFLVHLYSDY